MKTTILMLIVGGCGLVLLGFVAMAAAQMAAHSSLLQKWREQFKARPGRLSAFQLFSFSAFFLSCFSAHSATNLLSLTYVNGTNNGNVFWASNIFVPRQKFIVQSLGITNEASGSYLTNGITNSITVHFQLSVDASNTNWVTLSTWTPIGTNALVANIDDEFARIALPMRAQVITTNALGVSVFKQ